MGSDWYGGHAAARISARGVLARHRWATALLESRANPGPATLRQHDAVLIVSGPRGFSLELAAVAETILGRLRPDEYPHLTEFVAQHAMQPGYDFNDEYEYGLDWSSTNSSGPAHPPDPDPPSGGSHTVADIVVRPEPTTHADAAQDFEGESRRTNHRGRSTTLFADDSGATERPADTPFAFGRRPVEGVGPRAVGLIERHSGEYRVLTARSVGVGVALTTE
ncbi:hypothetical protein [Rhodococcus wratislaviensis]|uniref:hypothetical protein n=1 Tax=Rhodococcus wratislaviensis TaxID=44752 RepID=UPI00366A05D7